MVFSCSGGKGFVPVLKNRRDTTIHIHSFTDITAVDGSHFEVHSSSPDSPIHEHISV